MARIAEFEEADDAWRFCKLKGEDYTVVGGLQMMWAVMPKLTYATEFSAFDAPELRVVSESDDE